MFCYIFSSLDVSGLTKVTNLNVSSNALTKLDVSKNKNLNSLYADGNKLTTFRLSDHDNLRYISLINNKLQTEKGKSNYNWSQDYGQSLRKAFIRSRMWKNKYISEE